MMIENGLRRMGDLLAGRAKRAFGKRGEEGSALVEFALTLPMLFGLIYLGATLTLGMYKLQQLGNATAATAMAVGSDAGLFPNNDPCAYVKSTMAASLPSWTAANFTYSLVITDASDATHTYPGTGTSFSCTTAPSMGPNYPVTLTVTYTYSWLGIPVMPFFNAHTKTAGSLSSSQSAIQM